MGLTDGAQDQHEVRGEGDGDQRPAVSTNTSTGRVGFGMIILYWDAVLKCLSSGFVSNPFYITFRQCF